MQSPGLPKASRPSTALSPLAGPRAVGGMCIFSTFIIDRRRKLRCSGHSTAARSAARQSSVVSLLMEMRNALRKHGRPFPGRPSYANARCFALVSFHHDDRRNSGCVSRGAGDATCCPQQALSERPMMLLVAVATRRTDSSSRGPCDVAEYVSLACGEMQAPRQTVHRPSSAQRSLAEEIAHGRTNPFSFI
jgi:hypothetical protein